MHILIFARLGFVLSWLLKGIGLHIINSISMDFLLYFSLSNYCIRFNFQCQSITPSIGSTLVLKEFLSVFLEYSTRFCNIDGLLSFQLCTQLFQKLSHSVPLPLSFAFLSHILNKLKVKFEKNRN